VENAAWRVPLSRAIRLFPYLNYHSRLILLANWLNIWENVINFYIINSISHARNRIINKRIAVNICRYMHDKRWSHPRRDGRRFIRSVSLLCIPIFRYAKCRVSEIAGLTYSDLFMSLSTLETLIKQRDRPRDDDERPFCQAIASASLFRAEFFVVAAKKQHLMMTWLQLRKDQAGRRVSMRGRYENLSRRS